MARVDHEAVLRDLTLAIAEKTQHGRDQLLPLIAQLQKEHEVPESLIERCARIYGLPRLIHAIPETEVSALPDSLRAGIPDGHGPPMTEGGHDGSRTEEVNGRRPA